MRVLRVSHSAAVDEWRGRERAMRGLGADVTLLSASRSREGAGVVRLEPRVGEQATGVATIGNHPALFLYDPRPLWHALGQHRDVIDIHEEPFALATAEILVLRALRRNTAPVVLYTAQNLSKRYPIPFRWLERWALRSAAGISACNTDAAAIVVAKGFSGRPRVIPLGIDPDRFGPLPANAPTEAGTITVGFLGRLVPEKGMEVLLEALRREPRLHARVGGTGPSADGLVARAEALRLRDRVTYVGAVSPDDVVKFYGSVDVLAIPSLTTPHWTEQFGRVAIEAMACGVPVVASDAGALPDVVAGAGIIVSERDAAALAAAVVAAAGPLRQELQMAGFTRAAECTWDAVAADYLDLYRSVAHAPSAASAPAVEIIVVAYGSPQLLRSALEPVRLMPVTVVDNSSLPEIAQLCTELGVRYIDSEANRGFAGGVNLALADRLIPGADVLLLNPDARIDPEQVAELQVAMRSRPDLATVGPRQTDDTGNSARVEWVLPSPCNSWVEAVGLARFQRGPRFVIGSVLLMRAEALDQVGPLDERFFLYSEETDWAYRAHRLGWRHAEVPSVSAIHQGAGTSTDARRREVHFHASQERYFRKHFGAAGWQSVRIAVWLGAMVRAVLFSGDRGRSARRRAALYRLGPVRIEARFRSAIS